jgi:hypothetical protein
MQLTKKITLALIAFAMAFSLQAQVAIKAGVNFSNMLFEEADNSVEDLARNGATKFTAGLSFILPLGDAVALQPEILYTQKGAETTYTVLNTSYSNKLTYSYLDIPLLLRLSLGDTHGEGLGIYVNGGGYVGYALSGRTESSSPLGTIERDITFDDEDGQGRVDYGWALGGGLTLGNVFFDARYSRGINNLLDNDANNGNDDIKKLQHRGLAVTAGIIF